MPRIPTTPGGPTWDWDKVGGTLVRDAAGWHAVRVAYVSNVEETVNPYAVLYRLMSRKPCPLVGEDVHPAIPYLPVASVSGRCLDKDPFRYEITVTYELFTAGTEPEVPDPTVARLEVGATLQATQTMRDADGEVIAVKYNSAEASDDPTWSQQVAEVSYQEPQVVFRYSRRETESPGAKAIIYVGSVNSVHIPSLGQPGEEDNSRKWLCTRIVGSSPDNGTSWDVDYEFQYNEDLALPAWDPGAASAYDSGWDPLIVYTLPNGSTPVDIMDHKHWEAPTSGEDPVNQAIRRIRVFKEYDFIAGDLPV